MDRLAKEKSPYLRHAAHQKINWYPWSEEAFEQARKEDKPVFLSSGATWCHWCHVMARECFEDEEIADALNEHFISIKLDRDERPDIDRRYQQVLTAMGYGGGWPLSVFLTPDKIPFFGGTYFPPDDAHGRPGFRKVLKTVSEYYLSHRRELSASSQQFAEALKTRHPAGGEIDSKSIDEAVGKALSHFDPQNGGFGLSPKFPMPGIVTYLLNRFFVTKAESTGYAVRKTLEMMAKGGIHDQVGGGFHRYSVDSEWIIPHFEKLADDNAWHLRVYTDAYAVFGSEYFKEVAMGIIRFLKEVLSDPAGGFYASQDADVSPDDEGGYFTWTDRDFKRALNDEEYKVLSLHLLHERGATHHDPSKKTLFVAEDIREIVSKTGLDRQTVLTIISNGKSKLLAERNSRKPPFVDKTLYTSLNGMLISSFLKAFRIFREDGLKKFALKSLRRIVSLYLKDRELFHTDGVKGVLDDFIYLIEAFVAAYEVTGEAAYSQSADKLLQLCMVKFWDSEGGGFFDTDVDVVGVRLKGVEDLPHPSANALGIMLMLKLHFMTGKKEYREFAETALKAFSSTAEQAAVHAGTYYCSLDTFFSMM
ncbi:MAG: thioredoxin domain-containing protein, partial [Nitrospirota bacterium]